MRARAQNLVGDVDTAAEAYWVSGRIDRNALRAAVGSDVRLYA